MRRDNGSKAGGPHQLRQRAEDMLGGVHIEVSSRLVGQQNSRRVGNRPRDGYALLFAARKLRWPVVQASTQSQIFEEFNRPRRCFCALEAPDHLRQQHVFERREFRQQMMRLIDKSDFIAPNARPLMVGENGGRAAFDINIAMIWMLEQTSNMQQCRFAST